MPVSNETESQIQRVSVLKPLRSFQAASLGSCCLRAKRLNRSLMKWRTIKITGQIVDLSRASSCGPLALSP